MLVKVWEALDYFSKFSVHKNHLDVLKNADILLYMEFFFKVDTDELIYKTETDSQTLRMNIWLPRGKGEGEG